MPASPPLSSFLPPLELSCQDDAMLQDLAVTLVASNLEQCSGPAPGQDRSRWRELLVDHSSNGVRRKSAAGVKQGLAPRKEELRVFEERDTSKQPLLIPSLLLVGTVAGSVDDLLLGYTRPLVAPGRLTAEQAMQIKSRCVQDGAVDFKLLRTIVAPTTRSPLRHVSIMWRRFETTDYTTLDATGVLTSSNGELIGYSLCHSVDFAQLPTFERKGIDRGNVSVCTLFRQSAPNRVAVYARGFFDLNCDRQKDAHLYNIELRAAGSRWMKVRRHLEFARMRKLRWRLHAVHGASNGCRDSEDAVGDGVKSRGKHRQNCTACGKSAGFLATRRRCALCRQSTCSACQVKRSLFDVVDPASFAVSEHKKTLCSPCDRKSSRTDAWVVACDERDASVDATVSSPVFVRSRNSSFRLSTRSWQSPQGGGIFI